jgi:hypothetical protein
MFRTRKAKDIRESIQPTEAISRRGTDEKTLAGRDLDTDSILSKEKSLKSFFKANFGSKKSSRANTSLSLEEKSPLSVEPLEYEQPSVGARATRAFKKLTARVFGSSKKPRISRYVQRRLVKVRWR